MARIGSFLMCVVVCASAPASPAWSAETEPRPPGRRVCLPPAETREEIKTKHLLAPFAVLKSAAAQYRAEALSAKLCRIGDEFIYVIALLHRDGRFVHVVVNAATGKPIDMRRPRDPMPKN